MYLVRAFLFAAVVESQEPPFDKDQKPVTMSLKAATTGHITVKSDDGEVILDSDVVCTRNEEKANEFNLKTNVDLGWWNYDVRVVFNEEDGSFRFDNVYEGTVYQQN